MFIACVLAFIAGIYVEAVYPAGFRLLSLCMCGALGITGFLIRGRNARLTGVVLIGAFALAGMMRLSVATLDQSSTDIDPAPALYTGTVVESSGSTAVMRLRSPAEHSGTRLLVKTDTKASIGDRITVFGSVREIGVTFRNPHHISWRWLKRLEGVFYEVRGSVLSLSPGQGMIERLRRYLSERIDASGTSYPEVIKALTIGDMSGLTDETRNLFLETGTSHILSISGSHLAIITAFFFFVSRWAFRRKSSLRQNGNDRRYAAILTVPFAILFMLVAGSSLPTVRATIMIVIYMLAVFFERTRHGENALFLSALAILVVYPHSIFTPSFQLTFMSVLFIMIAGRHAYHLMREFPAVLRWLLSLVIVSTAAMLGTLPAVLYHFHGFNPLSFLHNLIAIPLMCMVSTPLALCGLVFPFGDHLLRLSGHAVVLTVVVLKYLNRGYIYPVIRPDLLEASLYFALALCLLFTGRRIVRVALFACVLPLCIVAAGMACHKRFFNDEVCVSYLDVGLGDAIVIEAPHGKRLLVDGGGFHGTQFDTGKNVVAPFLLSKKIVTIDHVINTHPHEDHLAGLRYILRNFDVRSLASAPIDRGQFGPKALKDVAGERGIPWQSLSPGAVIPVSSGIDIAVLHGRASPRDDNVNDASVVLRMTYGQESFLFTGDIGEDVERGLILSRAPLRSSVMKVPHHGSRYSSTPHFIGAVGPRAAVLSTGPGIKGIPSQETLDRYSALRVPLYRTDRDGCITICTDGMGLTVRTEGGR